MMNDVIMMYDLQQTSRPNLNYLYLVERKKMSDFDRELRKKSPTSKFLKNTDFLFLRICSRAAAHPHSHTKKHEHSILTFNSKFKKLVVKSSKRVIELCSSRDHHCPTGCVVAAGCYFTFQFWQITRVRKEGQNYGPEWS
jgi:hypothetical protein